MTEVLSQHPSSLPPVGNMWSAWTRPNKMCGPPYIFSQVSYSVEHGDSFRMVIRASKTQMKRLYTQITPARTENGRASTFRD